MASERLRVGIAGAGMVARVHLDAARRWGAEISGISAATPERGRQAAVELGVDRAYADSQSLVTSPDVDIVHICTPNSQHYPLAELALRAGKHIICEKPLATSAAQATELARLARDAGVVAAVPFVYRYHPMAAEARARAHSGELGEIRLIHGHYLQDWLSQRADNNWRVDPAAGGPSRAFADIGSHWCDLAEWMTGARIRELIADTAIAWSERAAATAKTFTTGSGEGSERVSTEDAAHLIFRTDGGATGTLTVSQVSPGRKNQLWIEVDGSAASVTFDQENPETLLVGRRDSTELVRRDGQLAPAASRLSTLPAGHGLGYCDCFAAFVRDVYAAVAGEKAPHTYPTFEDAARTALLTDAVLTSARNRTWIELPGVAGSPPPAPAA